MDNTTSMEGVFQTTKKDGSTYFRSSLTYKRKHISLGSFDTPSQAHHAYAAAKDCINHALSLSSYSENCTLSFEKWVILCNYRDNNIYFSTPIYIRGKYFDYYLDKHTALKFDMDDLFYFSSHKIQRRGNHLFVSDYGLQVSILTRFGIKPYAVAGIDYHFANNDSFDFRRQNLIILNKYHGVRCTIKNSSPLFQARIHVKGYYRIGTYHTMEEAAIAYNKAIDILKRNGVDKNFIPNYLEGISPSKYADIYTALPISEKIMNYRP